MEVSGQNRVPAAYIRPRALAADWDVPAAYVMVIGKAVATDPSGRAVYRASAFGCSLVGSGGSNPAEGMVVCCQVQVSASGRFLVQRSSTECGVSECDR
jgi:hypothetical protein